MRAILVLVHLFFALLLFGCGGPLQYPKGYDPTGFPDRSRIEVVTAPPGVQDRSATVSGQVQDEQGLPIIGAVIQITGSRFTGFFGGVSDEGGRFSVTLPGVEGPLDIKVEGLEAYAARAKGVPYPPGTALAVSVTLSPCGPCQGSGIVDPEAMINYKSTASGASFLVDERTGELRVRRPP